MCAICDQDKAETSWSGLLSESLCIAFLQSLTLTHCCWTVGNRANQAAFFQAYNSVQDLDLQPNFPFPSATAAISNEPNENWITLDKIMTWALNSNRRPLQSKNQGLGKFEEQADSLSDVTVVFVCSFCLTMKVCYVHIFLNYIWYYIRVNNFVKKM